MKTLLSALALVAFVFFFNWALPGPEEVSYYLRPSEMEAAKEKCAPHQGLTGVGVANQLGGVKFHAACQDGQTIVWKK